MTAPIVRPLPDSETESKLSLQLTMQIALTGNLAECCRRCASKTHRRRIGFRMVQHIGGIQPDLQALGFAEPDRLAEIHVKSPSARPEDRSDTHCRNRPGFGVLKKNLAGLRIRDRIERAKALQVRRERCALGISNSAERARCPIGPVRGRRPLELPHHCLGTGPRCRAGQFRKASCWRRPSLVRHCSH